MPNIHYSVDAEWAIGGGDEGDSPYVRLTPEQKMTIVKAVCEAVWKVEYDGQEPNGSIMGNVVLKETVFDEDGTPNTTVTVFDPNKNKVSTV